jgi:hypothetical protein
MLPPRQRHALPESEELTPKTAAITDDARGAEAMAGLLAQTLRRQQAHRIDNRQPRAEALRDGC